MLESIIAWLATADQTHSALRFIGLPQLAAWWLRRRRGGGAVKSGGIEFFPDRPALESVHGKLSTRLAGASHVDGIFVTAQKFIHADVNLHLLKRLLLPDPTGESFRYHSKLTHHGDTIKHVRDMTKRALECGIKVKWYDHFIHHSILLVDTDKAHGWVHFESVLPYSKIDSRPSVTIYRSRFEQAVLDTQRIFDEMWDAAHAPKP